MNITITTTRAANVSTYADGVDIGSKEGQNSVLFAFDAVDILAVYSRVLFYVFKVL